MKNHPKSPKGFTLVELLVVIGIIAVLAAVIAPVCQSLSARSRAVNCSRNLRQIGLATMLYAGDNQMTLPQSTHQKVSNSWRVTLQPYASGTITFRCKDDPHKTRGNTYVLNDYLTKTPSGAPPDLNYSILAKIDRPEATLMFAEASASYLNADHFHFADYYGQKLPPAAFESQVGVRSHADKANYLFADGHVETLPWTEVKLRLRTPGTRFLNPAGL
ncbi:prepilin-type N-terminal cleavage/methylation domain-containing protein [bacterium]|nr:prepilin-type N-terminal cleavage/methylation domain-containing protein [bacterium]